MSARREVWITGIGLVSALGEGPDQHWDKLMAGGTPAFDDKTFAPYITFPVAPLNLDTQIPKKGDQRQMEAWQRIGVYAAGLALTDAGIAKNTEILDKADMIIAAGGGERDVAVDAAILTDVRKIECARSVRQRTADERSAPYSLSRAIAEPSRRQHLARAWRGRLLAHLHGRGSLRRRCAARRACAHRGRPKRTLAGRRRL